jgi:peptide chain release factor 2
LNSRIDLWNTIRRELDELEILAEILAENEDPELLAEFYARSGVLKKSIKNDQIILLMGQEYDDANAILSIHPGAGGLDSQDWAEMLFRIYMRWAESHGMETRVFDLLQDDEAGIKSVTFMIKGPYAYGFLSGEQGVHRLVRISPFDAAKRRHTSFASVEVAPELPESVEIEIRPEDLELQTCRASGAGGQYVNMTDSAVRIKHIPTGIVVGCQPERSQHMNRQVAMQLLRARLFERVLKERREQLEALKGEKKEIGWGSQIRSYVLHPYTLVKDHRTGCETGNVQAVLDGEIDDFLMAALNYRKSGKQPVSDRGERTE